uniref:EF-hand domain-containing protein n=1 Tax=Auxenochlorella protothecoides TaxID=3075 RepID=A0A1D2A1G0_AUXPR
MRGEVPLLSAHNDGARDQPFGPRPVDDQSVSELGPLTIAQHDGRRLEEAFPLLSPSIRKWLRVHGRTVRPRMTAQQLADMEMCFNMMDSDASGAIDASELSDAFGHARQLLGIRIGPTGIAALLDKVDKDGTGEIELGEFSEMMTEQLAQLAQGAESASAAGLLSLDVVVVGYRRAKLLQALQGADNEFLLATAAGEAAAQAGARGREASPLPEGRGPGVAEPIPLRAARPTSLQARRARAVLERALGQRSRVLGLET